MVLKWQMRAAPPSKEGNKKLKNIETKRQQRFTLQPNLGMPFEDSNRKVSEPQIETIDSMQNKPTLIKAKNKFLKANRGSVTEGIKKSGHASITKEDFRNNIIKNSLKYQSLPNKNFKTDSET